MYCHKIGDPKKEISIDINIYLYSIELNMYILMKKIISIPDDFNNILNYIKNDYNINDNSIKLIKNWFNKNFNDSIYIPKNFNKINNQKEYITRYGRKTYIKY
jgi:hypothetical protein